MTAIVPKLLPASTPNAPESAQPTTQREPQVLARNSGAGVSSLAVDLPQRAREVMQRSAQSARARVVIVGGGFAGLATAKELRRANVDVTLVDKENYHLFQPLLYQVATGGLSPADIATPLRTALAGQKNARVVMGEVTNVDLDQHLVQLKNGKDLPYDYLVLAAGSQTSYRGHEEWAPTALGLKGIDDAIEMRRRMLTAFEEAEQESDPERKKQLLTFVIIGGGATGVELAGALAEFAKVTVTKEFKNVKPGDARIVVLEHGERVLSAFDPELSKKAYAQMQEIGVEVLFNTAVTGITPGTVHTKDGDISARTVLWAAGVKANSLSERVPAAKDRGGRIAVQKDSSLASHREVFAIGDIANFTDKNGKSLPGLAPVAMQQGVQVGKNIKRDLAGKEREAFEYNDRGTMAVVGRSRAVMQAGKIKLSGFVAWAAFAAIHVMKLASFRNRASVFFNWMWAHVTRKGGSGIITQATPRLPQAPQAKIQQVEAPRRAGVDLSKIAGQITGAVAEEQARQKQAAVAGVVNASEGDKSRGQKDLLSSGVSI